MYQPGRLVADEADAPCPLLALDGSPAPSPDPADEGRLERTDTKAPADARDRPSAPGGRDRILARGDHLFVAGDAAGPRPYLVVSGALVLSRLLPDGRRQIVDILGAGRLAGLADGETHASTASAAVRSQVRRLHGPASASAVARELSVGLSRMHDLALLLGRKSALEKVATGLLWLADLFGSRWPSEHRDASSFVLPLTRSDLGDWLGLVVETVSRSLTDLQRRGLIAIERTDVVHILDADGLCALTGERPPRPVVFG